MLGIFNFGINLVLTGATKYFIKIVSDIKIKIGIFRMSVRPDFNKFWAFSILGPIWAGLTGGKYFIKIIFDILWAINNWLHADERLYPDKLF